MDIQQIKNLKLNFILATARTGSTLLSAMLNAHPNVVSTFEEPFAYNLYPKYKNVIKWTSETIQEFCFDFYLFSEGFLEIQFGTKRDLETLLEINKQSLTAEIAIKLAYLCFFPNKDKSEITTIVDKQLKFHFCLKEVAVFYPQSKFIILYRDPRDTALLRRRLLKIENIKRLGFYTISNSWKNVYERLQKFKKKIDGNRFLEIKYEDLVSNPEIELKKICSFMDIPYNHLMLKFDEQVINEMARNREKLSVDTQNLISLLHEGISQKVHTNKVGIWKQGLKKEEADLIWTICGDLAEKIGYKGDEHFVKQNIKTATYYLTYLTMVARKSITFLYYHSPFFVRHLIKKIKYGRKFKSDGYTSEVYYKKTYHSN